MPRGDGTGPAGKGQGQARKEASVLVRGQNAELRVERVGD